MRLVGWRVGREAVVDGDEACYVREGAGVFGRGQQLREGGLEFGFVLGGVAPGATVDEAVGILSNLWRLFSDCTPSSSSSSSSSSSIYYFILNFFY